MASPLFAYGTSENLQNFIKSKKFLAQGRVLYAYETDTELWAFVRENGTIYHIKGTNEELVKRVDVLPPVETAIQNALYIVDDVVYSFNGSEFIPTYQDITDDISELRTAIENTYTKEEVDALIGDIGGEQSITEYVADSIATALEFEEVL